MKKRDLYLRIFFSLTSLPAIVSPQIDITGKVKSQANSEANSADEECINKGFDEVDKGARNTI